MVGLIYYGIMEEVWRKYGRAVSEYQEMVRDWVYQYIWVAYERKRYGRSAVSGKVRG